MSLINIIKDVDRDSHIASSPISQSCFFKEVSCLILASLQRNLHGYIEFLKFDVTIKKIFKKLQILRGLALYFLITCIGTK